MEASQIPGRKLSKETKLQAQTSQKGPGASDEPEPTKTVATAIFTVSVTAKLNKSCYV